MEKGGGGNMIEGMEGMEEEEEGMECVCVCVCMFFWGGGVDLGLGGGWEEIIGGVNDYRGGVGRSGGERDFRGVELIGGKRW